MEKKIIPVILIVSTILLILLNPAALLAGPPFFTDDPEPVEYRHMEFYIASQSRFTEDAKEITAPHFEINYGIIPDVQLHLITPFLYTKDNGDVKHYGYSDTEAGIKWRFIQETDYIPMVGIFPIVELPTGDEGKGLGNGKAQYFLPVWIQKKRDQWSSYGGGGYWINPGKGNKNYWFAGWQVQREISKMLSIGAEFFHRSASEEGGEDGTGFNVGAVINLGELHHILMSAGRDIDGPNTFTGYFSYQLTIGTAGSQ
jgi:hypothetical protein